MDPGEDPEQHIAELERSLSKAAATSEVASVAERPRTSMRIGWIVLGLMILGLVIGGVLGTFAAVPLVTAIGGHLDAMRGLVIVVVLYAAVSMLMAARKAAPPSTL